MEKFEEYKIQFSGLKEGEHEFYYHIADKFFALFDYNEFNAVDVEVKLLLNKKPNMLTLTFDIEGTVNVNCDVTNEAYDQEINTVLDLKVKFGSVFNDEDDEYLILPYEAHEVEVQQYIYEGIILAVPLKKVHPKVIDGTMESDILDKLEELSPGYEKEEKEETDPRWDKLKKLLNEK